MIALTRHAIRRKVLRLRFRRQRFGRRHRSAMGQAVRLHGEHRGRGITTTVSVTRRASKDLLLDFCYCPPIRRQYGEMGIFNKQVQEREKT